MLFEIYCCKVPFYSPLQQSTEVVKLLELKESSTRFMIHKLEIFELKPRKTRELSAKRSVLPAIEKRKVLFDFIALLNLAWAANIACFLVTKIS